jgi:hypothetical protein
MSVSSRRFHLNVRWFAGCMGPAVYMLTASYAGCHRALSEVLVMIALGLMGVTLAGCRLVVFDLSPNYAGFLVAFCNLPGFIASTFTPAVVHAFLPNVSGKLNVVLKIVVRLSGDCERVQADIFFLFSPISTRKFCLCCDLRRQIEEMESTGATSKTCDCN